MAPPRAWVVASESCSSTSPRATTCGSSLEMSASNARPREQATCRPAAASCRAPPRRRGRWRRAGTARAGRSPPGGSGRWRARPTRVRCHRRTRGRARRGGSGQTGVGMSVPSVDLSERARGGAVGARRHPRQRRNRAARSAAPAGCGGAAPAGRPGPPARHRPRAPARGRCPARSPRPGRRHRQAAGVGGELAQQRVAGSAADEVHDVDVPAGRGRCASPTVLRWASARLSRMHRTVSAGVRGAGWPVRRQRLGDPGGHVARAAGTRVVGSTTGVRAGTAAASREQPVQVTAVPAASHVRRRLLQQPQAHDVAQVADGAVDAQLVGEVGPPAGLGEHRLRPARRPTSDQVPQEM